MLDKPIMLLAYHNFFEKVWHTIMHAYILPSFLV